MEKVIFIDAKIKKIFSQKSAKNKLFLKKREYKVFEPIITFFLNFY